MPLEIESVDFVWYVPEYRGNRERWQKGVDKEPFMVEIKPTSYADARAAARLKDQVSDADADSYFLSHIREIRNLRIGGVEVTSGKQLHEMMDRVEPALFRELNKVLVNRAGLDEGVKKSFD